MPDQDPKTQPTIDIHDMDAFVRKHSTSSPRLPEYLKAVKDILDSSNADVIRLGFRVLQNFAEETGQVVWIGGLTGLSNEVASSFGEHVAG